MDGIKSESGFPAIVTPDRINLNQGQAHECLIQNKAALQALLLKHGALLFRGFPVRSASDFSKFIQSLHLGEFLNYIGGDSPRDKVDDQVYTSTEAPPNFYIPLHQELSFIRNFPKHIYFFCETPAEQGGATIIGDARKIYAALDCEIKNEFETQGLTYTSNYYHESKIMDWVNRFQRSHKSWTTVFETESKSEVEKKCIDNNFSWTWNAKNWLNIKQTTSAILQHPQTQETVWFNQAHLYDFNPRLLGWKRYLGAKLFYLRPSTRLHEIRFTNGKRIPRSYFYHILDVLNENAVAEPWQKGDVMILDNILAMHGRAPFLGKRRVLTAMTS